MIKGRNRAASGHQQVHTKAGRYNYTKIVEMAAETCYADYGYLVLHLNSSHGKFEVIATHNMGGIDLKLITQGPLLSATVKDTSLAIQHAYEDDRLKKNKIMHLTSELHVSVTGANIHMVPSTDFKIHHYHEFRIGEYASLILLDKSHVVVRTDAMIRHVEAVCDLVAREVMMEGKLVELRGRIIAEVGVELADKTRMYNAVVDNVGQGVVIKSRMGDILECNKAARALIGDMASKFGTGGMDAVGRDGGKIEREDDPVTRAQESGCAVEGVAMGIKKDGKVVWVHVSAFPLSGQNILITIDGSGGSSGSRPASDETIVKETSKQIDVEEPPPEKDEIDEENEMLFAMLNAMSDEQ